MGTDNLFYKGTERREKRRTEIIEKRTTTWLIVCEGTVTEKNYFEDFIKHINKYGKHQVEVKVIGTGTNTKSLVGKVEDFFEYVDREYR